jgi:hypothetical protein
MPKHLLLAALVVVGAATWGIHARAAHARLRSLPDTTLWAWQRPEKLTFLDRRKTAVAVLVETVTLSSPLSLERRNQPIAAPDGTDYIAVVRIQAPQNADLSTATRARVADSIAAFAANPHTRAVQVDFDATASQRDFYRALLKDLRAHLPQEMPLSMTALVSWCEGDDWIADLPVDEAVPMYFRMGVDEPNIRRSHMDVKNLREPLCRSSVGVSLDEPWPRFNSGTRVYAFAPAAWTEADYDRTMEKLAR